MAEEKVEALEKQLAELKDTMLKMSVKPEPKTSRTVFISKDRKLLKFSGRKSDELTVEEWIDDASYHLKNISGESEQVEFLYDHLSGQARDELRVVAEVDRDEPSKIFDILRVLFQDEDTSAQIQQVFFQRAQKYGETLQQYSLALLKIMERLCKKQKEVIGNKELMLRERFIDGVLDHQLKREMRRFSMEHPRTTFQEFRTIVIKWCEDEKKVVSSSQEVEVNAVRKEPEVDVASILKSQQEMLITQQKQLDLLTSMMKPSNQSSQPVGQHQGGFRGRGGGRSYSTRGARSGFSRSCFQCGSPDHFIRNCPSKQSDSQGAEKGPNQKN